MEWKVAVGDTVVVDQVVVEVETAKATVEVPSPYAGVVEVLHGAPGATLIVGTALIGIAGAAAATRADTDPGGEAVAAGHEPHRQEERAGSGNVLIGYGTSAPGARRRGRVRPPSAGMTPWRDPVSCLRPCQPALRCSP